MSKMKTFLEATAERVAAEKNCTVDEAQAWILRILQEDNKESYEGKLEYMRTIEQLHPASHDAKRMRILQRVVEKGWCLETESVDVLQQTSLIRSYGLVDTLGYEVMAILPLSDGVSSSLWIEKLESDINLYLEEQKGERRAERDLGGMGSQSDLNLHSSIAKDVAQSDLNFQPMDERELVSSLVNNALTGAHKSPYEAVGFTHFHPLHPDSIVYGEDGNPHSVRSLPKFNMRRFNDCFIRSEPSKYHTISEPGIREEGKYGDVDVEGALKEKVYYNPDLLHNRELATVNVWSTGLDKETKLAIVEEAKVNADYFFKIILGATTYSKEDVLAWARNRAKGQFGLLTQEYFAKLVTGKEGCPKVEMDRAIDVMLSTPLRTLSTVPYKVLVRPVITTGEWSVVKFLVNHLVK